MKYDELSREELIERLEAEEKRRNVDSSGLERDRLLHELEAHQVELEAQNQALREAQGQLEESRSRYADLYDFAPIAYLTFDPSGVVLESNLTGAALLGKERSRIIGKPFVALAGLDSAGAFFRHLKETLESATSVAGEVTLSTTRGPLDLQLVSAAVRDRTGTPKACRTALLDVTQLRRAERESRDAHASERALRRRLEDIDRASAAVTAALTRVSGLDIHELLRVIVDQARTVADAEYAALGIESRPGQRFDPWVFTGMTAEQAATIGRTPRPVGLLGAVIHATRPIRLRDIREHGSFSGFPPHHPPMTSFLAAPIRYQGAVRGSLFLANKRGVEEFTEDDQNVIEMLADRAGIAIEIARLRQVEIREHKRLEFLANAGPLLAESMDYELTLQAIARLVVPAIADLSAVDLLEEGGALRKTVIYHPDPAKQSLLDKLLGSTPAERLPRAIRAAIETGQPQRCEVSAEFLRSEVSDSKYREVIAEIGAKSSILAPLVVHRRVIGLLRLTMAESGRTFTDEDTSLGQEIAHHAALAIDRARLYRSAQRAIAARDNLLAVVSHDLRNYLTSIRMSAELLSRAEPAVHGRRELEAITRSATLMTKLIESLRDATMIETGQLTVETKAVDVASMVEDAIRALAPQAEARGLRLAVQVPEDLPPVICDQDRICQVIANLVGNALKFTESGGQIRISARAVAGTVCFSVSDTGTGIPHEQVAHVFERYWKERRSGRGGTGLGLFIAKGIVEAHHGAIWAESRLGVGSSFFFTLPAMMEQGIHSTM